MEAEYTEGLKFHVTVNGKMYNVEAFGDKNLNSYFEVEGDHSYLFTLSMDEDGQWCAEKETSVLDKNLVEQVGGAIEEHDGK